MSETVPGEDPRHVAALPRVREANARLQLFLERVEEALAGRGNFTPEDLRALAAPVRGMAALIPFAGTLRAASPEWSEQLDRYAGNLSETQRAFERLRCVLLARRAQIEARRGHLEALRRWAGAWQQTR